MNRYTSVNDDNEFFLPQLQNDIEFGKCIRSEIGKNILEIIEHFVDWIEVAPTFEQKSNLLDTILLNFPTLHSSENQALGELSQRFRDIETSLSFSEDTPIHERNIYNDNQNIHTSILIPTTLRALSGVCIWWKVFPEEDYAPEVLEQMGWSIESVNAPRVSKVQEALGYSSCDLYLDILKKYSKTKLDKSGNDEFSFDEIVEAVRTRCKIDHTTLHISDDIAIEEPIRADFASESDSDDDHIGDNRDGDSNDSGTVSDTSRVTKIHTKPKTLITFSEAITCLIKYVLFSPRPQDERKVLVSRFFQEMNEAVKLCASGYLARGLNALQGFTNGEYLISISNIVRIRGIISHHVSKSLLELPESPQKDSIIDGTFADDGPEKDSYLQFLCDVLNTSSSSEGSSILKELLEEGEGVFDEVAIVLEEMTQIQNRFVLSDGVIILCRSSIIE